MTIPLPLYSREKYIAGYRIGMDRTPEDILGERIRLWREKRLGIDLHRIFAFYGKPGVGKSWLLFCLKDKAFKEAIYIDLDRREEFSTHAKFLREIEKLVPSSLSYKETLLLIDHVPNTRTDTYLQVFEKKVLIPCYEGGGLLIFACQHPRDWCWETIPHPPAPFVLGGFNDKGKKGLLKRHKLSPGTKSILLGSQETSPLLVWLHSQSNEDVEISEGYLRYWLSSTDRIALEKLNEELRLAGALTWLVSPTDVKGMIEIINILSEKVVHLRILETLSRRQWITPDDEWEESIRKVLNLWFRHHESDLARILDRQFRR